MFEDKKTRFMSVPEDIADMLDEENSVDKVKAAIRHKYENRVEWFVADLEALEDAAARFKGVAAIHKAELDKALVEQDRVLQDLGARAGDMQSKALAKARQVNDTIKDVERTVKSLEGKAGNSLWKLDKLMDTVQKVASMDEHTKKLLGLVLSASQEDRT